MEYPLIEAIDDQYCTVTFLYHEGQSPVENIVLHGTGIGFEYMKNRMEKIADTNIWYKTYRLPNDIEFIYWMSISDRLDDDSVYRHNNFTLDTLNPKTFFMKDDPEKPVGKDFVSSYVRMPKNPNKEWTQKNHKVPEGDLEKVLFKSERLNNERRLWIYTPIGMKRDNCQVKKLLILNDGNTYVNWLSATKVLDHLIHAKKIEPVIVVFVSSTATRVDELTFNDEYNAFLTTELLPYIQTRHPADRTKNDTLLGGFSLGGLASAYACLKHPDVFGKCISQSGSFFWKDSTYKQDEWLLDQYEKHPPLAVEFYITYGILENTPIAKPTLIESNERMISILKAKNYKVTSEVFRSGHDYLNWGETFASAMIALIASDR
ncbi:MULTISPECIES: esterase family protein [unclassified Fusibacter]|uniref:alpha/beta hydrolase n=1 Tax=unclassified Fusibacter TaxID=2624464 RepID=UPI0010104E50|nr:MULTISPECIES: alpha/beta hydrolase-fold protein [unclassified Fusibacter]MCK8059499.1 alpha/beta hydrolase-fold protein [Fusibacter sp. A2]NPE21037.1 DUF3327 domain-containing protein [Fusibacter sp. A1]RXV62311.1 DUF3327 domain-containing protein [Fusibacter sp. A1]